ncbi:phospholipid/cholesterol/gamma-HCH transport system permease protein [Pseudoxanthobacter soli DSM 19599]|uniref:Phospholipid/cholesterol/gamma-HCH transport system permease protein n=1 Tax=Pseudoxanthobacter soli DSM 19599 TaxID=1123029 RepID=A0A1M7ZQD0_9HYPH|nr:MlaE family lipid ABC transporter permease subunit [Pseudoxanthobacter soli]SHO67095.1 phospholipid/cholesterol/gamma-HCH transport system permease protein [Pseudoxanthobacter soli DSM 19599]
MSVAVARQPQLDVQANDDAAVIAVSGDWVIAAGRMAEDAIDAVSLPGCTRVRMDFADLAELDTSGAWLLHRLRAHLEYAGVRVELVNLEPLRAKLLAEVGFRTPVPWVPPRRGRFSLLSIPEGVGRTTMSVLADAAAVTNVLGAFVIAIGGIFVGRTRLRMPSIISNLDRVGFGAVPIMVLMSFLIGAIICQQGAFYLRRFGADLYVVDLVGVLVLREMGVLLTAIMFAGRSGSAFTAEIGSMKMREEIDAMKVIGVSPIEVLILPRLIALMIALPILTFISDMAALVGAGLTMWSYLGVPPDTFITQLQVAVDIPTLMVGLYKAPMMALIIGLISCVEGMKVGGSAESLGRQTTTSVVKSIFMVIFVDGVFAVFFATVGI